MTRALFETVHDRKNEQEVADVMAKHWQVTMKKLPMSQRLDYAMMQGGTVVALCEIKCRKFKWGEFPDVMLSASKVKFANEMFKAFAVKTLFIVSDRENVIKFTPIHEATFSITFGGRTASPRDNQDSELIVNIPNDCFETITNDLTTERIR